MNKTKQLITFVILISALAAMMSTLQASEKDSAHWSYEGEEGPEHWGELIDAYRMCSDGANQSPIDLVADVHANLPELQFEYFSHSMVDETNNGHTIQQTIKPGSFLKIPSRDLSAELKQFHFHSPSEHTIAGKSYDMELHFVHFDENGALLVVGVLIQEGKEHPVLNQLWSFMPQNPGETSQEAVSIEETNLLPDTREYFSYSGSLTTPPCSEGVKWIVIKTPIEASARQIAIFKERVGEATNRPIQPHNARLIVD
jgi:carbonic anhydrase